MKKLLFTVLLTSVVTLQNVSAETEPASIIVIEETKMIQSDAMKSIINQIEKKKADAHTEMTNYENEFQEKGRKLAEEKSKLSEKMFTEKMQAFETNLTGVREKIELRKAQIDIAFEEAKQKVYQVFLRISDEVKQEAGASMIVKKEAVIAYNPSTDYTDQVLQKLNKELPTVQVTFKSESEVKQMIAKQFSEAQ